MLLLCNVMVIELLQKRTTRRVESKMTGLLWGTIPILRVSMNERNESFILSV
jgi:hypothetical protein